MAAVNECFTIGSIVACKTCFSQEIVGEVIAFDPNNRMLILKCAKADGSKLHDVYIVNINMCDDVQVTKEAQMAPETPPSLNLTRLSTRMRNQVEQKKRLMSALAAGVSREGQNLYMAISKTIPEATWNGPNIVVFNDVVIKPPYNVDNVTGAPGSRQLTYVKKIVEKHTSSPSSASDGLAGGGGGGGVVEESSTIASKNSF